MQPNVLVMSGYGLNCEEETLAAFELAGAKGKIVHINDLIENPQLFGKFQIIAIPGGFSYGDDTGSGKAFANRIINNLWDEFLGFLSRDTLLIGICNGCQITANLGLVPGLSGKFGERKVALLHNASNRYQCRWVDLKVDENKSPWLADISSLHVPVAHGEGNFYMEDDVYAKLKSNGQLVLRYAKNGAAAGGEFPYNPNGSMDDIAGITDESGRILALMPHPERGMLFTQRDDFPLQKEKLIREGKPLPEFSDGIAIFQNAVKYFQ